MSEYRRLVSYIYLYDKGIKVKNSGFAKIECKDNTLRIKMNLKGVFNNHDKWKVYLLIEKYNELQGIYVGDLKGIGTSAEFQMSSMADNINGTSKNFDDLKGLAVTSAGNKKYATFWKDTDLTIEYFKEYNEKETKIRINKINTSLEKIFNISNYKETKEEELLKAMSVQNKDIEKKQEPDKEEPENSSEREIQVKSLDKKLIQGENIQFQNNIKENNVKENTIKENIIRENTIRENIQEKNLSKEELQEGNLNENWDIIVAQYKKINPFPDNEIECIRIELKDLRILPKSQWLLSNNSFVLHGFYNYQYLIIGKINNKFMLGVPGVYCNKEKLVAGIFGFNEFKPAQVSEYKTGRFGYWYKYL